MEASGVSTKGIREFCEIAMAKSYTTPERVREVVSDCVRAQKAGRDIPLGEIFMSRRYLSRSQVSDIMKELYGNESQPETPSSLAKNRLPVSELIPDSDSEIEYPQAATSTLVPENAKPIPTEPEPPTPLPEVVVREQPERSVFTQIKESNLLRVPWTYYALLGVIFLGASFVASALAIQFLTPAPVSLLPEQEVRLIPAKSLMGRLSPVSTEWVETGNQEIGLRILYTYPGGIKAAQLPNTLIATTFHQGVLIETTTVPIEMSYDRLVSLSQGIGNEDLVGEKGILSNPPSGVLFVQLKYPKMASHLVLSEPGRVE